MYENILVFGLYLNFEETENDLKKFLKSLEDGKFQK